MNHKNVQNLKMPIWSKDTDCGKTKGNVIQLQSKLYNALKTNTTHRKVEENSIVN